MAWIDVPEFGQFYQARNKKLANHKSVNLYPHISSTSASRDRVSLEPMPGNLLFAEAGVGKNRGAIKHKNSLYVVNGSNLYLIDHLGAATELGVIDGNGLVSMDTDGSNLVIVTGGKGYVYNLSLNEIVDGDFKNARTVTYFNDRFIYDTPNGWCASDIAQPGSITSTNCAAIVSTKDPFGSALGVFSFGQKFFPYSSTTIESWWNPGGDINFTREDFAFEQGVVGTYAVGNNNNFVYLLGSDLIPYRFSGLSKQAIGNQAIGREIQSYGDASDCQVICQEWDNQHYVWFIFPSADRSFLFNEESNSWWSMANGLNLSRHVINSAVDVYGKKIICDYRNANIYELDWNTYLDNQETKYWEAVSQPLNHKAFGLLPSRLFFQGARIILETGEAPVTGQGSTPQLMLSWSKDNGNSYVGEVMLDCGTSGDRNREIVYHSGMGFIESHENLLVKIRMTDPQRWAINSMQVNVEAGI